MIEEILKDESIRHWIWWTIIPLSIIIGATITAISARCIVEVKK